MNTSRSSRVGGIGDVDFVGFGWQRSMHGEILHIFRNFQKHILSLRRELFTLDCNLADAMEDAFYSRWRKVKIDLYYASALMNPYLLHDKKLADNSDSLSEEGVPKLCPPETYSNIVQHFLAFQHKQGPFHDMLDLNKQKCLPHDWWAFEGTCGRLIALVAKRILRQAVLSSSWKCNWSNYLFVHNKSWNRLQLQRAEDLVYMYINSWLLAGKEKDEKKWYVNNVDSEDSNFALEEDVKIHGDADLDGWDDGYLWVQNLDEETNSSPLGSSKTVYKIWKMSTHFVAMEMTTLRLFHLQQRM
jgi:hypothetical protein